jgi:hypothetical protein
MICLEISLNQKLMYFAGVENAIMLSPTLSSFVGDEYPACIDVSGMCDLPDERRAHIYWGEPTFLHAGDVVRIAMVESASPTPPAKVEATDSAEYVEEQRQFEEFERTYLPPDAPAVRRWPAVQFLCKVNGEHRTTVTLAPGEEHILCSLLWNQWHPNKCEVYIRSFVGATRQDDDRQTEWLRVNLSLNESLEVEVRGA